MTEKPAEQGRVASLISALKNLLSESPLLFIVTVTCLIPLGAGIVANALSFDWGNTIALVLVLSGVIILVVIPLTITQGWKENQRKLSGARQTAIESEAERRNEQERNKQNRLNQLMDAKMEVLKAEKDYILDQSERHERRLLKETAEALGKQMTKGLEFADKAKNFDLSVTEVVAKLEATDIKFDSVLESLEKISRGLESGGAAELPEPEAPHDYESELEEKDAIIENLEDLMKSSGDTIAELRKERDDLQFTLEKRPLRKRDHVISSDSLEEALKVVDNLEDSAPQEHDPQFLAEQNRILTGDASDLPISTPTEYDNAVQEEQRELPGPKSKFWTCPKCNRANILKRPRCVCGTSKPL